MRSPYHFTYIKTVKLESQRLEEGALSILRYLDTFTTSCFMYYGLRKQTYQYYSYINEPEIVTTLRLTSARPGWNLRPFGSQFLKSAQRTS